MSARVRWLLLVAAIGAVIVTALLVARWNDPPAPPLPSEDATAPETPAALPGRTGSPVEDELACIDRLLAGNVPEGANLQAEWARCAELRDQPVDPARLPPPSR